MYIFPCFSPVAQAFHTSSQRTLRHRQSAGSRRAKCGGWIVGIGSEITSRLEKYAESYMGCGIKEISCRSCPRLGWSWLRKVVWWAGAGVGAAAAAAAMNSEIWIGTHACGPVRNETAGNETATASRR